MEQQLFDAIKAGRVDEVRDLIQKDASLKQARDASGASVILVAAYHMKPDVVNALLEVGAPVDIFAASVLGKVDRIYEILKANPGRVSEHAPDGFTPVALAELLLRHGADPSLTNDDGKSAIDLAREKGHAEFADWLETQRPA